MLKVKLGTAIIGISSIHLLKTFINARAYEKTLLSQTGITCFLIRMAIATATASWQTANADRNTSLTSEELIMTPSSSKKT